MDASPWRLQHCWLALCGRGELFLDVGFHGAVGAGHQGGANPIGDEIGHDGGDQGRRAAVLTGIMGVQVLEAHGDPDGDAKDEASGEQGDGLGDPEDAVFLDVLPVHVGEGGDPADEQAAHQDAGGDRGGGLAGGPQEGDSQCGVAEKHPELGGNLLQGVHEGSMRGLAVEGKNGVFGGVRVVRTHLWFAGATPLGMGLYVRGVELAIWLIGVGEGVKDRGEF